MQSIVTSEKMLWLNYSYFVSVIKRDWCRQTYALCCNRLWAYILFNSVFLTIYWNITAFCIWNKLEITQHFRKSSQTIIYYLKLESYVVCHVVRWSLTITACSLQASRCLSGVLGRGIPRVRLRGIGSPTHCKCNGKPKSRDFDLFNLNFNFCASCNLVWFTCIYKKSLDEHK